VTQYLKTMNTAALDAANVVRRLREFYRQREEAEVFHPVDLNALVEEVVMLTQPRWKDQALASGVTVHVETHLERVPAVVGNASELREVATNLIFNAVDAMPEGGTLTLRTRPDGDHVVLEVRDTGIGMSDEVRQRCIEPFFSTKGEGGTGLGLAMVYGIIQRHGGTIAIESEVGTGTAFIVGLPVQTESRHEGEPTQAGAVSRQLRILLVEDEPSVRDIVAEYLVGDGHSVETANHGGEGLQKFQAGWFDVVVTDKAMPDLSGDQLATMIKRIVPTKPIIMLTGFGGGEGSTEPSANVDMILGKPVTLTTLRDALAKVIEP
jgi:CheY-like chemotaxis protein